MDPHDPGVPPATAPANNPPHAPAHEAPDAPPPAVDRPRAGVLWAWSLAAGLLAGLVAWVGGEATLDNYRVSEEAAGRAFDFAQLNLEMRAANARNAAIAFGLLGATLGLALGLAAGMVRRRPRSGLVGVVVGLVLGGAAGGLIPFVVVPIYYDQVDPTAPTLLLPMLVNGAVWVPIGLAAGLAFGLGLGGRGRIRAALLGGLVGGVLGTALVETINAVAFPLARSEQFIPSAGPYVGDEFDWEHFYLLRGGSTAVPAGPGEQAIDQFTVDSATAAARQRLIARLIVPLLIAAAVAWSARSRPARPRAS